MSAKAGRTIPSESLNLGRWGSIDELVKLIKKLEKKHGIFKVNLVHEGEGGGNEGVWAVPLSVKDMELLASRSSGDFAYVRLLNCPLGWGDRLWGSVVKVKTNGDFRAHAYIFDQKDHELNNDLKHLMEVQVAYFREREELERKRAAQTGKDKPKEEKAKSLEGRGKRKHG